jgi:hypothetical protein
LIKERDTRGARHQFMQQAQPLGAQLRRHVVDAGNIAARAAEACHDTGLHRVSAGGKYVRNGGGRGLRGESSCRADRCDDHRHRTPHQIGRQVREPTVVAVRPAEFDYDVAALGITDFSKALSERRQKTGVRLRKARMEKSNDRHRGLLRVRRERRRRCAAEQRDELAPSHAGHGLPSQWVCRTISLPSTRWQVRVADLNRSEFRVLPLRVEMAMTPIWGICK